MVKKYMVGDKVGTLTLVEKTDERAYNYVVWICKCDCGNFQKRSTQYFGLNGNESTCRDCAKEHQRESIMTHGLYSKYPRLTRIAKEVISRCENPKNTNYHNYGGRGIKFKFNSLENFVEWSLKNGYKDGYSIERKDVNGNYDPENCCWIPLKIQAKNKRTTPKFNGIKGLQAIADYIGITNKALQALVYKKKMTFEEVYEASKKDPTFHLSLYEKTSIKARQRKHEWKLSKQNVEDIIKQLDEGVSKSHLARKVYKVDYSTIEKAIQRYEQGLYD